MNRAFYSNFADKFVLENSDSIFGQITRNYDLHKLNIQQANAWKEQIVILKNSLDNLSGKIYFEFTIPRMGKRVDNILIVDNCIFILEFKIGSKLYDKYAKDQVFDYGLDLNNFHEGSHNKIILPILISDKAVSIEPQFNPIYENLYDTIVANSNNLNKILKQCIVYFKDKDKKIDISNWENSIYKPTPTIIEAATILFKNHSVEDISRNDAGENLTVTSSRISEIIDSSKLNKKKSICFITGVPGAGKTLAGLNIANLRLSHEDEEHAVFLSGNVPLVEVLKAALIQDKFKNPKEEGLLSRKSIESQPVKKLIQNIHHFRDAYIKEKKAPIEKVAIFDEAQRAWTKEQASKFMRTNKNNFEFNMSEPEFLIKVMDRHEDWCTIVCLVGGGQEINTGEIGLEGWILPFKNKFQNWNIYYSSEIEKDTTYIKDEKVLEILKERKAKKESALHLSVSLRSFRSAQLSNFVHQIVANDLDEAKRIYKQSIEKDYPIKITRNLATAKNWLKGKAKGSDRIGIVASSGAHRLKPFGINAKTKISAPHWFLNGKEDVRSSFFLEEIATEFFVQGLELDYVCIAWDGNFFYNENKWNFKKFIGTQWNNINNEEKKGYLLNSYRVLLTRARQGMVIFIPEGDREDHTRPSTIYDGTFEFFKNIGIEEI